MAQSAFPMRHTDPDTEHQAACVSLQDADGLIEALSSEMGRQILTALHDDAMPPSAIADTVDTSIQNVTYHLDRLQEAGLVVVADTWYSSRGREMDVYALRSDPITLCIGEVETPLDDTATADISRRKSNHRRSSTVGQ